MLSLLPLLVSLQRMVPTAQADCLGTRSFLSFTAVSPPDPTVFFFPDGAPAVAPRFQATDQDGRALPLLIEALPGVAGGMPVWRLQPDTDPLTTRTVQLDLLGHAEAAPEPLARLQIRPADRTPTAPLSAPTLTGARWSRFAWTCSHEDALWLAVSATEGVLAWELTLPSGEILFLPPSPLRFFDAAPRAGEELGLGEINCLLGETLSWAGQPTAPWSVEIRAWYADGRRSPPVQGAVDVRSLRFAR